VKKTGDCKKLSDYFAINSFYVLFLLFSSFSSSLSLFLSFSFFLKIGSFLRSTSTQMSFKCRALILYVRPIVQRYICFTCTRTRARVHTHTHTHTQKGTQRKLHAQVATDARQRKKVSVEENSRTALLRSNFTRRKCVGG